VESIKVKPYPFPITLFIKEQPFPAEVMKITGIGLICKVTQSIYLRVGHNTKGSFTMPLEAKEHMVDMKVMKSWDHVDKTYLFELHFLKPEPQLLSEIMQFTKKIGQK
jgi:hypothetical protein